MFFKTKPICSQTSQNIRNLWNVFLVSQKKHTTLAGTLASGLNALSSATAGRLCGKAQQADLGDRADYL
jgi:hypothetical protein